MKPLLIQVPPTDPTSPIMLVPLYTAVLRQAGYAQTVQRDLNVEVFTALLQPESLAATLAQIRARLAELDARDRLDGEEQIRYAALARASLRGPHLLASIGDALGVLRDPERFYDLARYRDAVRTLQHTFDLIATAGWPGALNPFDYHIQFVSQTSLQQLLGEVQQARDDPLTRFFDRVLPTLQAEAPDFILLEATYAGQLQPALVLACRLRRALNHVPIALAGGYSTVLLPEAWEGDPGTCSELFRLVDYLLIPPFREVYDGLATARTAKGLVQALDRGEEPQAVPNLVYRRADGQVVTTPQDSTVDMESLPTPAFGDLPLAEYIAPEVALPIALSQGCYWARCAFCVRRDHYAARPVQRVVAELGELHQRFGVRIFRFINDSNPPDHLQALCEAILDARLDIRWSCFSRFDANLTHDLCELMYRAGCRQVWFGLESYSARVIQLMDKGTERATIARIVRDASAAGLATVVCSFTGFPTETESEAQETVDFLVSHRDCISKSSHGVFLLQRGARVFEQPQAFGVRRIYRARDTLSDTRSYEVEFGMDSQQALAAFRRCAEQLDQAFGAHLCFNLDNSISLFYYTFGAHCLLHIDRWGAARFNQPEREQPTEEAKPKLSLDHPLQVNPLVQLAPFRYDVSKLEAVLARSRQRFIDSAMSQAGPEAERPPAVAALERPGNYVYHAGRDRLYAVGAATVALLKACGDHVPPGTLLERFGNQPAVQRALEQLVENGILVQTPIAEPSGAGQR